MHSYRIHVGTELDKDQRPITPHCAEKAVRHLLRVAARLFGGATLTEHLGSYRYNNGRIAIEKSVTFSIGTERSVKAFAEHAKRDLNQESVYVESDHTGEIGAIGDE